MTEPILTNLERAVLTEICRQYPGDQPALEAQVAGARVANRENTGAGFFTYLEISGLNRFRVGGERARGHVHAKIAGLGCEMGFVLFLRDGNLECLEGYLVGDGTTTRLDLMDLTFELTEVAPPIKTSGEA